MLSSVGLVSCMLVLSTVFVVVKPLTLARVDGAGQMLCTHGVLDEADDHLSPSYRRILIQSDSDPEDVYGFPDEEDANDEESEERTEREWRKFRRYVKRQLKVPKRYLKKIVRSFKKGASVRSANADDGLDSETDVFNSIQASDRFDTERMLVVKEPESVEYFAVIAVRPGSQIYQ